RERRGDPLGAELAPGVGPSGARVHRRLLAVGGAGLRAGGRRRRARAATDARPDELRAGGAPPGARGAGPGARPADAARSAAEPRLRAAAGGPPELTLAAPGARSRC